MGGQAHAHGSGQGAALYLVHAADQGVGGQELGLGPPVGPEAGARAPDRVHAPFSGAGAAGAGARPGSGTSSKASWPPLRPRQWLMGHTTTLANYEIGRASCRERV